MTEFFEWRDAPKADFAVIGDPVSHSLSPAMHAAAYRELELPYRYVAIRVPVGEVGDALTRLQWLGYIGINVTVPHKEEALNWCTSPDPFCQKVRAANTIRLADRTCINTDAPGFLKTLDPFEFEFESRSALVLGAGGSARALVTAMVDSGWTVSIYNRTPEKAHELARLAGASFIEAADPLGASLIINTTSASIDGLTLPVLWDRAKQAIAYDLMYPASRSIFLARAAEAGLRTVDGLDLLVAQGGLSFEWWLGRSAPFLAMGQAVLRELVPAPQPRSAWIVTPGPKHIAEAAECLRHGRLVGMPTETVYGIAVDARNEYAIKRLFSLKGRPPENPLIVHLADQEMLKEVALDFPEEGKRLAEAFWPGPLTLVLRKRPEVSNLVTGGLDTVAVRVPGHPIARSLIQELGSPIAAPSANQFMALSPTKAIHISRQILEGLDIVLDGGNCEVGLESTVLDLTTTPFTLLRPGAISRAEIEKLVGPISDSTTEERRSPGLYKRHYAPKTRLEIVETLSPEDRGITLEAPLNDWQFRLPTDPKKYAAQLYATLRDLDTGNLPIIRVQAPPRTPPWEAVWDRLTRAAG